MDFEIRNGFVKTKELQSCFMDDDLRHSLWNLHEELFDQIISRYRSESDKQALNNLLAFYWTDFFKQPITNFSLAYYITQRRSDIQKLYYELRWSKVYSFLEFTANFLNYYMRNQYDTYKESCNFLLERENSAYRFIGDVISPITIPIEISEIETCLAIGDEAAMHIESSLTLLANKEKDQSRESVAQSILAVEAIAKKVTNKPNAQLGDLYKKIPLPSHQQLREALKNLYNYTSGKDGIRHALVESSEPVSKSLAQFMLVTCSAFVNLIRTESTAAKKTLEASF